MPDASEIPPLRFTFPTKIGAMPLAKKCPSGEVTRVPLEVSNFADPRDRRVRVGTPPDTVIVKVSNATTSPSNTFASLVIKSRPKMVIASLGPIVIGPPVIVTSLPL